MVTIDYDNLREKVLFAIQHYGTKTQGEEHRQKLVAEHIVEMVTELHNAWATCITDDLKGQRVVLKLGIA